jgi:hypothetical protein
MRSYRRFPRALPETKINKTINQKSSNISVQKYQNSRGSKRTMRPTGMAFISPFIASG